MLGRVIEGPVPVPSDGRVHTGRVRVRLGDVAPDGRARLDSVARWLQDVARDDTRELGLHDTPAETWVVRRTELWITRRPRFDDMIEMRTFCGGVGGRWAERRTSITVEGEPGVEAASLWVCIDPASGRPQRLSEQFTRVWAPAAHGRKVSARRRVPDPPTPEARSAVDWRPWPLRRSDFDVLGHLNNAAAWAAVDEVVGHDGLAHVVLDHVAELKPGTDARLGVAPGDDGTTLVWLTSDSGLHAAAHATPR